MPINEYISVFRVMRKGEFMIIFATVFSMIFLMILSVIVAYFINSKFFAIILMALSIIFVPIFVWQHQMLKWKIWAFSRVNNIPKLFSKIQETFQEDNPAITKTILPYKKKKAKIEEIIWNRKHNNLFEVELQDRFYPAQTNFYYSPIRYGGYLIIGFILLYPFTKIPEENGLDLMIIKITVLLVSFFFFYLAIRKLINRKPVIYINNFGVYTSKTGFLKWDNIQNIEVAVFNQTKGRYRYKEKIVRIEYLSEDGLQKVKYDIETLNVSAIEMDEIIQTYQKRHQQQ